MKSALPMKTVSLGKTAIMLSPARCLRQNPLLEASIATAVTRSSRNTGWPKPQNEPTLGRNLNRWRILSDGLHQDDNNFRLVYWLKASSYSEPSSLGKNVFGRSS